MYLSESLHLTEVADYWRAVIDMNEHQKQRFTNRIISCLFNNLNGKRIAVLGFAFKANTSDTRESPAITLVSNFIAERAQVAIYDPRVEGQQILRELADDGTDISFLMAAVEICQSAYSACEGADAVVVATEWDEFSNQPSTCNVEGKTARLDWSRVAKSMRKPMFVFDGRNVLDGSKLEALGFRVEAIGKASSRPRFIKD